MLVVNVKDNFRTVEESREILYSCLKKNNGKEKIIKVIHGYGSTGRGGDIKKALKKTFNNLVKSQKIVDYIDGIDFQPFNEKTMKLISEYKNIKNDKDLIFLNEGITILILK